MPFCIDKPVQEVKGQLLLDLSELQTDGFRKCGLKAIIMHSTR